MRPSHQADRHVDQETAQLGSFVAGVELIEERGSGRHLFTRRDHEAAARGWGGTVVRAGDRYPVVHSARAAPELDALAGGRSTHRVADDVDFRGAGAVVLTTRIQSPVGAEVTIGHVRVDRWFLGEPQHTFTDDVVLDLVGAAGD